MTKADRLVEQALLEAFGNKPQLKISGKDCGAPYHVYADIGYSDEDDTFNPLAYAKKLAKKHGLRWSAAKSHHGESAFPSVFGSFDTLDKAAAFYTDCYESPNLELDLEAGEDGGTCAYYTPQ